MSWVATAIVAASAITAGVSVYQGNKQTKSIKNAQADAESANRKALEEAQLAQDTAESQAKEQIKARRKRMAANETIFTSPMGLSDQSQYTRKTLLGS